MLPDRITVLVGAEGVIYLEVLELELQPIRGKTCRPQKTRFIPWRLCLLREPTLEN